MSSLFEKEQIEARAFINSKQFKDSIHVCITILEFMNANNIENNYDRWFFNLRLGINYKRLKQCKKALVYTEQSMKYCNVDMEKEYIESIWMIGSCNDILGNKKRALKFYNKCLDYYRRNNMHINETYMLFNIGRLYKDIKIINNVIDIYNTNDVPDSSKDNAYETLFEIYIYNKDVINAEKMINCIIDIDKKQELLAKMSNVYSICI
jgi:tetratricopeptide (TPR) repeat protein